VVEDPGQLARRRVDLFVGEGKARQPRDVQDLFAVDHVAQYAERRYCPAMSQSNLELVRGQWAPFAGLDATTVDWGSEPVREMLLSVADPEIELSWSTSWAGERHYKGKDGVVQAFQEWIEPFSEYRAEALDFIEAGDRVLVPNRQWGVGKTSGVPVEIEVTWVYELRDGLIARIDEYDSLDEAQAAAGLAP
jgi:ketosteroid isomerase-like protein